MHMAYHPLPRFDPSASYVATKPFILFGVPMVAGSPIPAELPKRRVQQLYEVRKVTIAPKAKPVIPVLPTHQKEKVTRGR